MTEMDVTIKEGTESLELYLNDEVVSIYLKSSDRGTLCKVYDYDTDEYEVVLPVKRHLLPRLSGDTFIIEKDTFYGYVNIRGNSLKIITREELYDFKYVEYGRALV